MSKDLKELVNGYNDLLIQAIELNQRNSEHGKKILAQVLGSVIGINKDIDKGLLK